MQKSVATVGRVPVAACQQQISVNKNSMTMTMPSQTEEEVRGL